MPLRRLVSRIVLYDRYIVASVFAVQLFHLLCAARKQPVAFGSNVERLMFPMHSAPTRLGIEQGLRGDPSRGPGCHQPDPVIFKNVFLLACSAARTKALFPRYIILSLAADAVSEAS